MLSVCVGQKTKTPQPLHGEILVCAYCLLSSRAPGPSRDNSKNILVTYTGGTQQTRGLLGDAHWVSCGVSCTKDTCFTQHFPNPTELFLTRVTYKHPLKLRLCGINSGPCCLDANASRAQTTRYRLSTARCLHLTCLLASLGYTTCEDAPFECTADKMLSHLLS